MKLEARDWQKLQFPSLFLVLVLTFVCLLVWFSSAREALVQQALSRQESQLGQAIKRYQESGAEKDAIVRYLPVYKQLISQGFVGEERRIEWIDELRNINQQFKLFGINYAIEAQEDFNPPFRHDAGQFMLHRSVMKIDAALLHEGDLLTIFAALRKKDFAPFMVRECVISQRGSAIKNKFLPNLDAQCELDWLTLTEPLQAGGEAK